MATHCQAQALYFTRVGPRKVVGEFDGGRMPLHVGALLLREINEKRNILARIAECFPGRRRKYGDIERGCASYFSNALP